MNKIWVEHIDNDNRYDFGMSSALGASVADLPMTVEPGSSAFDYTTKTVYFFDGKEWK